LDALFIPKEGEISMKKIPLYFILVVVCLLSVQGNGLAETMYVTDRLYLSLRKGPDTGEPSLMVLPSDTKVDVIETEGNWAQVKLESGKTGWVIKKYLVKDVPKSLIIEQLKEQMGKKSLIPERLQKENAALKKEIDGLKSEILQKNKRLEVTSKEKTLKRLKEIYATGIVALLGGIVIGYLVRRPKKSRY
jgi:SH3 domain protein